MVQKNSLTLILSGPTAAGKTELAYRLVREYGNIEIINGDSLQIYKELEIGTAKPEKKEFELCPHHLFNIYHPDQIYDASLFRKNVLEILPKIHARKNIPVIVGGTAFYLKALLYGMWETGDNDLELRKELEKKSTEDLYNEFYKKDEKSALKISKNDRYRLLRSLEIIHVTGKTPSELEKEASKIPDPQFRLWLIERDSEELFQRIEKRTEKMLESGFVDEVKSLIEKHPKAKWLNSVGYAQVVSYLNGEIPKGRKIKPGPDGLKDEIALATRQMVKNQRTWFKNLPFNERFMMDQDLNRFVIKFKEKFL